MPNNVVELVVRTLDEATPGLKAISGALQSLQTTAAAFGTVEIFKKFIENTAAAETATVRLTQAFEHSVESIYTTRTALQDFAETTGKSSVFSVVAVQNMETSLLRFDRVTGPVFERARADVLDLAAGMGVDLNQAAFSVGRALENPATGLRVLTSLGIVFDQSQRQLITELVKTGDVLKADDIILQAIEAHFKGAAEASGKTLGGSLSRLKNSFEELFKVGKDGSSAFAQFFNALADGANKVQPVISKIENSIANIATVALKAGYSAAGWAFNFATGLAGFGPSGGPSAAPGAPARPGAPTPSAEALARQRAIQSGDAWTLSLNALQEFQPSNLNRQITAGGQFSKFLDLSQNDKIKATNDQLFDSIATGAQKSQAAFDDLRATMLELNVSQEQYNASMSEFLDKELPGIQVTVRKMIPPLTEAQIAVKNFVGDFTSALGNLATRGGLSMRNLFADFARALADRAIFRAIEAIGTALENALSPKGGAASGGFAGLVVSAIGALFGRAGGGDFSGLTVVGEDGPELVAGRGTVMNRRQLQFALGNAASSAGQAVHYAPQTNIVVQGNADEKTLKYVEARLAQSQKDQRNWLSDTLYRNGYQRLR